MGGNYGHERIGIGLVGFTGDWLVEMAIALAPPAIVSSTSVCTLVAPAAFPIPVWSCTVHTIASSCEQMSQPCAEALCDALPSWLEITIRHDATAVDHVWRLH